MGLASPVRNGPGPLTVYSDCPLGITPVIYRTVICYVNLILPTCSEGPVGLLYCGRPSPEGHAAFMVVRGRESRLSFLPVTSSQCGHESWPDNQDMASQSQGVNESWQGNAMCYRQVARDCIGGGERRVI